MYSAEMQRAVCGNVRIGRWLQCGARCLALYTFRDAHLGRHRHSEHPLRCCQHLRRSCSRAADGNVPERAQNADGAIASGSVKPVECVFPGVAAVCPGPRPGRQWSSKFSR
ncbi:hypothetical protein V5799_008905 [Amblyomma americanum]|uniref:Uncharacterized protein n=1 Tax=Amblyomma americanum TaxID=6943 RepID=A0AAQ4FD93_AMBAM